MVHKTLHWKINIDQRESNKYRCELGCSEKVREVLLHYRHLSCYSDYKSGDKSWMRKGSGFYYDKRNISVPIFEYLSMF